MRPKVKPKVSSKVLISLKNILICRPSTETAAEMWKCAAVDSSASLREKETA
jgi:hypothetical protein